MAGAAFEVRACTEGDLKDWGRLCGEAFGHKPGRPERFLEKYEHDPSKDLEGVRIAVADGKVVGSVRVIRRTIVVDGKPVPMGGIGEVCTDPDYRGLGICKQLLNDAIAYMASQKLQLSILHAAEKVAPVYRRYGFENAGVVEYGTFRVEGDTSPPAGVQVEALSDYSAAAPQLVTLFDTYNKAFSGYTERGEEYWATYLKYLDHGHRVVARAEGGSQPIVATLALKRAGAHLQVADYAAAEEWGTGDAGLAMFQALLAAALRTPPSPPPPPYNEIRPGAVSAPKGVTGEAAPGESKAGEAAPGESKAGEPVPTDVVVLEAVLSRIGKSNAADELADKNWMFRLEDGAELTLGALSALFKAKKWVVWPSEFF